MATTKLNKVITDVALELLREMAAAGAELEAAAQKMRQARHDFEQYCIVADIDIADFTAEHTGENPFTGEKIVGGGVNPFTGERI